MVRPRDPSNVVDRLARKDFCIVERVAVALYVFALVVRIEHWAFRPTFEPAFSEPREHEGYGGALACEAHWNLEANDLVGVRTQGSTRGVAEASSLFL